MLENYLPISDYAVVGNGQTAALVGRNGSVDWCCWPRFDSPAVFCRLLDAERGGFFQISPTDAYQVHRKYIDSTNMLQTTFTTASGSICLTDWMPAPSEQNGERTFPHRILRQVKCVSGYVKMGVRLNPTFDYARVPVEFEFRPQGVVASGPSETLSLISPISLTDQKKLVSGHKSVSEGEELW